MNADDPIIILNEISLLDAMKTYSHSFFKIPNITNHDKKFNHHPYHCRLKIPAF